MANVIRNPLNEALLRGSENILNLLVRKREFDQRVALEQERIDLQREAQDLSGLVSLLPLVHNGKPLSQQTAPIQQAFTRVTGIEPGTPEFDQAILRPADMQDLLLQRFEALPEDQRNELLDERISLELTQLRQGQRSIEDMQIDLGLEAYQDITERALTDPQFMMNIGQSMMGLPLTTKAQIGGQEFEIHLEQVGPIASALWQNNQDNAVRWASLNQAQLQFDETVGNQIAGALIEQFGGVDPSQQLGMGAAKTVVNAFRSGGLEGLRQLGQSTNDERIREATALMMTGATVAQSAGNPLLALGGDIGMTAYLNAKARESPENGGFGLGEEAARQFVGDVMSAYQIAEEQGGPRSPFGTFSRPGIDRINQFFGIKPNPEGRIDFDANPTFGAQQGAQGTGPVFGPRPTPRQGQAPPPPPPPPPGSFDLDRRTRELGLMLSSGEITLSEARRLASEFPEVQQGQASLADVLRGARSGNQN